MEFCEKFSDWGYNSITDSAKSFGWMTDHLPERRIRRIKQGGKIVAIPCRRQEILKTPSVQKFSEGVKNFLASKQICVITVSIIVATQENAGEMRHLYVRDADYTRARSAAGDSERMMRTPIIINLTKWECQKRCSHFYIQV